MRYGVLFLGLIMGLLICVQSYADIPELINFQGRLIDASGKFVSDGDYSVTFKLYTDSTGGSAKWTETQIVSVSKGLFNVTLGSDNPIPDSIFNYSNVWLGIQVESDPEMTPRQRLSSLGYSYRTAKADTSSYSMNSDKLDGYDATAFTSVATDYGRSGVATDLYEGTTSLTNKYVNAQGPDSVVANSGTALVGYVSGSSSSTLEGMQGYASNNSTGNARGGTFYVSSLGSGSHTGILAEAHGSSSAYTYGVTGYSENNSNGTTVGGYFFTGSTGTAEKYGIKGDGFGASSSPAYGIYGTASNTSNGDAIGGYFRAQSSGTGSHCGIMGYADGSTSAIVHGIYGEASNTSTGTAVGGHFRVESSGSGLNMGIRAVGKGYSSSSSYGAYCSADNYSSGTAYAGYFECASAGTGTKYGVYSNVAPGSGYAGYFDGDGYFDGNVTITDSLVVLGTKSAAVEVNTGEYRLLYCQESPENWFEDFGGGTLSNGVAIIQIDPLFAQTVNTQIEYRVYLTPEGDCKGLYVTNKTLSSFEVRELQSGSSNISFSYRIVAKRRGYENVRLEKMMGQTPEEMEAERAGRQAEMEKERANMEDERIKMEQRRQDMRK